MDSKISALLVVLIGVVITLWMASGGRDVGTLFGVAVVALGLNLLWHAVRRPAQEASGEGKRVSK